MKGHNEHSIRTKAFKNTIARVFLENKELSFIYFFFGKGKKRVTMISDRSKTGIPFTLPILYVPKTS